MINHEKHPPLETFAPGAASPPSMNKVLRLIALISIAAMQPGDQAFAAGTPTDAKQGVARHATAVPPTLEDCPDEHRCPLLVRLPGATFTMGSPKDEPGRADDEGQHRVTVKPFAIAATPVTRIQWAQFVRATGRVAPKQPCAYAPSMHPSWDDPGFPQGDDHPVVCVTWDDAQAYVQWLSRSTGHRYRLPTDAEWEYAARGGTTTAYSWGAEASHEYANYGQDTCCGPAVKGRDKWEFTSPVGSFPPNPFGLFDMNGNVTQWVQTCADAFEKLPLRKDAKQCTYRYGRGGVYADEPAQLRSAAKNYAPPDDKTAIEIYRSAGFGIRVARDL
jgi:formylglycine-generating enzyme required for sulfatase activity